jgi:membrane fusion protein (multidrug efflux system)
LTSYPGLRVQGRVDRIDPTADPKSRRVGIYISVPNTNRTLFSGLFTTGTILTNEATSTQKILLMPSTAVRDENGETVVYAIEGENLVKRPVSLQPHAAEEGLMEVRSGISSGAKVLLSPSSDIKGGIKVKVSGAKKGA